MYIKLMTLNKNVGFYITNKWHQLGFNPNQLKLLIYGHLDGINISDITW